MRNETNVDIRETHEKVTTVHLSWPDIEKALLERACLIAGEKTGCRNRTVRITLRQSEAGSPAYAISQWTGKVIITDTLGSVPEADDPPADA